MISEGILAALQGGLLGILPTQYLRIFFGHCLCKGVSINMAQALSQASPLKPEIQLAQALSEYEAILDDAQKTKFGSFKSQVAPDAQAVMRLTADIDRNLALQRKSRRCVGPRLINLLQSVQQFTTVGDLVVSGSQNMIASSVWGVAKLSLQVCIYLLCALAFRTDWSCTVGSRLCSLLR